MPFITDIYAREVLDSRGNPTIEVEVEKGFATSAGPNGGQGENGFPSIGN